MSRLSEATKKQMYDHAVEVIEEESENRAAESKGYNRNPDRICRLYDISDDMFRASRIKSLLDELTEVYAQLTAYKEAQADKQRLVRDLDVLLNGREAAQQASLCDIVSQVQGMMRQGGIRPPCDESRYFEGGAHTCGAVVWICNKGHQHLTGRYIWDEPIPGHTHSLTLPNVQPGSKGEA